MMLMIQRRHSARLLLEVVGHLDRQNLQRHVAAEPRIARPIDLAHSARAQRRDDFVRSEARARSEWHGGIAPSGMYAPGWSSIPCATPDSRQARFGLRVPARKNPRSSLRLFLRFATF